MIFVLEAREKRNAQPDDQKSKNKIKKKKSTPIPPISASARAYVCVCGKEIEEGHRGTGFFFVFFFSSLLWPKKGLGLCVRTKARPDCRTAPNQTPRKSEREGESVCRRERERARAQGRSYTRASCPRARALLPVAKESARASEPATARARASAGPESVRCERAGTGSSN